MKFPRLLTAIAAGMLLLVSCNPPEPVKETVTVSVSPTSLSFPVEGGTETISVTSNGLWYVKVEGSWLGASESSGYGNGSVRISVSPNTGDARNSQVVFETADQKASVSVVQQQYVKPEPVTKSIDDVRALYKGEDYTIKDEIYVEGVVVSDYRRDTDGGLNNYSSAKTIIISDGNAGLMLYCKSDNKNFARGQQVRVSLKDQVLSVYNGGALQVNGLPLENIEVRGTETPEAREVTVEQLLSGRYESMYVAVKDVQVKQEFVGKTFYTTTEKGSIGFEGKDGGSFDLFTSQYAVFKDETVPSGSGTLKGIAGKYGSRIQMTVSQKSDYAGLTGERYDSEPYFTLLKEEVSVGGDEGSFSLIVSANVPWEAVSSHPEFTVTPDSGTVGGTVTISYTDNPSTTDTRQAVIKFSTRHEAISRKEISLTVTQQPFEAVVQSQVQAWMEMPAVKAEEGKGFFSHDMTFNGRSVRNYSFWFDLQNRVSLWVAYPLYEGMTRGVSRTDKWDFDPLVPRRYQGDATYSYSGYDRGHQLPSADRLCNVPANEQTFYFTNITPQNANLNQGIWETLEAKVRDQVSGSDTLYVVTGCVLSTEDAPDILYVKDVQGRDVAVPKAYYKVVLKYKSGTANGGYSAIGFWLENKSYGSQTITRSYAYTVDEIEKRTGFDFFVNLKDEYEKEAEAKFDASSWGL